MDLKWNYSIVDGKHQQTASRLYVLVAARAPAALVLRRGPSAWWHLLHWDLATLTVSPGAWFHGNLYPRRCDISADGRLFGYFVLKASMATPGWRGTYFAVSKVPWLEALVAWETCGTWTWGCQFSEDGELDVRACITKEPFHGSYPHKFSTGPMSTDWPKRDVWNETGAHLDDRSSGANPGSATSSVVGKSLVISHRKCGAQAKMETKERSASVTAARHNSTNFFSSLILLLLAAFAGVFRRGFPPPSCEHENGGGGMNQPTCGNRSYRFAAFSAGTHAAVLPDVLYLE